MGLELKIFNSELDEDFVNWLIDTRYPQINEHYTRLWDYYQNTSLSPSQAGLPVNKINDLCRNYVQAQEAGLPARITGINKLCSTGASSANAQRKEIVIENEGIIKTESEYATNA